MLGIDVFIVSLTSHTFVDLSSPFVTLEQHRRASNEPAAVEFQSAGNSPAFLGRGEDYVFGFTLWITTELFKLPSVLQVRNVQECVFISSELLD